MHDQTCFSNVLAKVCGKNDFEEKKKMHSKNYLTKTGAQCLDSGIVQDSRKVCIVCLPRCPSVTLGPLKELQFHLR